MKLLVTGAGGFLGGQVVKRLLERGHSVRAIIRPASSQPVWPATVEIFKADLRTQGDLGIAFDGIDAVIHLAAATSGSEDHQFLSTVVGTERFLDAMARSSVKRLVHVSSLVVYDWTQAKRVLDERTPLLDDAHDMGAYTNAKVWQERIVTRFAVENTVKLTVIRPGFIWGPGHADIAGMGRHFGKFYVMFGPLTRLPLCHIENCADCIVAAAESPNSIGESFNAIDGDDIRVWRYVRAFAKGSGQPGYMIPLPYHVGLWVAQFAALVSRILFGKGGKLPSLLMPLRYQWQFKPVRFDNRKLRNVLHWKPSLSFDKCSETSFRKLPAQDPAIEVK
jgi:nucleoside-diphosphate-sugar epimerase